MSFHVAGDLTERLGLWGRALHEFLALFAFTLGHLVGEGFALQNAQMPK